MKNKQSRLFLFAFLAQLFGFVGVGHAWVWQEVPDKTMTVRYRMSVAANISTAAVVIDLSDTVNYPHKETGQINISSMRIEFDKVATTTGTVKVGVVNFVNSSTGSVTWFYSKENVANVSNTGNVDVLQFQPNYLQCRIQPSTTLNTDGTPVFLISNDSLSGSTIYNAATKLPAPTAAGVAPGRGDIVVFAQSGTAAVTIQIEIQYHSQP